MKDDILVGDTPKAKQRRKRVKELQTRRPLEKHSMLAEVDGFLTEVELEGYFVFMMVRNPWDRMVSYYHWLRAQHFEHPAVRLAGQTTFAEFVEHPMTLGALRAAPYGAYVRDAQGRERCDLFIRLEDLATDIAPLEAHLGFALDALPHANKSEREADYRRYYTDNTQKLVAELAAEDIARFAYRF